MVHDDTESPCMIRVVHDDTERLGWYMMILRD